METNEEGMIAGALEDVFFRLYPIDILNHQDNPKNNNNHLLGYIEDKGSSW